MARTRTALVAFCIALALPILGLAETVRERAVALSRDPAQGGKITRTSRREALVGLKLERAGLLPGPIRREASGSSEFVDANGTRWDVKAFDSRWPVRTGGFLLVRAVGKIANELRAGENVILDTRHLAAQHKAQLQAAIARRGWTKRVLWVE